VNLVGRRRWLGRGAAGVCDGHLIHEDAFHDGVSRWSTSRIDADAARLATEIAAGSPSARRRLARASAWVWRTLAGEVAAVATVVRRRWRTRGPLGFASALTLGAAVVVASVLYRGHTGHQLVLACCGDRNGYPVDRWLARLPGSMVAPANSLPVWGSVAQVLLAFGLAEAAVGRRMTLGVAFLGHLVASAAGRWLLSSGALIGGLAADRFALDTGPSAATVSLAAYLAVVLRCPALGVACAGALVAAAFTHSGLAAGEHATAALVGLAAGAGHLGWLRWKAANLASSAEQHRPQPTRA